MLLCRLCQRLQTIRGESSSISVNMWTPVEDAECQITEADAMAASPILDHDNGIPNQDTCKKPSALRKYYNTTAGIMTAVRPCGYIVGVREMFTCESCTQWLMFLLDIFSADVTSGRLKGIVYDRACELHPFVCNTYATACEDWGAPEQVEVLRKLATNTKMRLDRFHSKTHKPGKCQPPILDTGELNPASKYHHSSPGMEELQGIPDSIGESVNRYLSSFAHSVSTMGRARFNLFIIVLCHMRNSRN